MPLLMLVRRNDDGDGGGGRYLVRLDVRSIAARLWPGVPSKAGVCEFPLQDLRRECAPPGAGAKPRYALEFEAVMEVALEDGPVGAFAMDIEDWVSRCWAADATASIDALRVSLAGKIRDAGGLPAFMGFVLQQAPVQAPVQTTVQAPPIRQLGEGEVVPLVSSLRFALIQKQLMLVAAQDECLELRRELARTRRR